MSLYYILDPPPTWPSLQLLAAPVEASSGNRTWGDKDPMSRSIIGVTPWGEGAREEGGGCLPRSAKRESASLHRLTASF